MAPQAPAPGETLVCVADVRLDNRDELLRELGLGPPDVGLSDAALIGLAYRRWGALSVEKLRGDFAFAIWDAATSTLFAGADPMGVRSLRYWIGRDLMIVGSRTGAVAAALPESATINDGLLTAYINGRLEGWRDQTIFKEIRPVPPGYALVATRDGCRLSRYCRIGDGRAECYRNPADYADRFRELLEKAVARRMRASGPVATTLSGGLDSSSVAAIAGRLCQLGRHSRPVHAHSFVFPDTPEADESVFQTSVLSRYPEIRGHSHSAESLWAYKGVFDDRRYLTDEVEFGAAQRPFRTHLACAAAANGARVLLVGQYADHALGPSVGRDLLLDTPLRTWHRELRRLRRVRGVRRSLREASAALRARLIPPLDPARMETGPLGRSSLGNHGADLAYRGLFDEVALLRRRVNQDYGAWAGVDVRDPYLDRDVVEFALKLPPAVRSIGGLPKYKYVLRQAMRDVLPEDVRLRTRRTTFNITDQRGVARERSRLRAAVSASRAVMRGLIAADTVERAWRQFEARTARGGHKIVRLIEVELRLGSLHGE